MRNLRDVPGARPLAEHGVDDEMSDEDDYAIKSTDAVLVRKRLALINVFED